MQHFAEIADGAVRSVVEIPDGLEIGTDVLTPEVAEALVACEALVAAGWGYDGKVFTAPVVSLPVVPVRTVLAPREFLALFTSAEQMALFTARRENVQIDQFITLAMAGPVDLDHCEVIADIGIVQAAGLLTVTRAKQILDGKVPPAA